jgi:hypothetical protein
MKKRINPLSFYKNHIVSKKVAIFIILKFLRQENILHDFLDAVKEFKPYKKGNDDVFYLISYVIGMSVSYDGSLRALFILGFSNKHQIDWFKISSKWKKTVGSIFIS